MYNSQKQKKNNFNRKKVSIMDRVKNCMMLYRCLNRRIKNKLIIKNRVSKF